MQRDIRKRFGARMQQLRQQYGLSQEEMSFRLGFERGYYGKVECGRKDCKLSTLDKVAEALGMSLGDLLAGV